MVVDAVLANDELDFVRFRISYLAELVDVFYIGESEVTFSGHPKALFFKPMLNQLKQSGAKVEVVNIKVPDQLIATGERWSVETYARNFLLEYVCENHRDDIVLFSDVDEIPSKEQVRTLIELGDSLRIRSVPTQVCLRKANWIEYWPNQWKGKWGNGLLGKYWVPRIRRGKYPFVGGEPGVHLSYVGMDSSDVRKKYRSFSHGELDREELSSESFLSFADDFHISHIGRALEPGAGLLTVVEPEDLTNLQTAAFEQNPSWFDFAPVSQPLHRRLVASWLLFMAIRGSLQGQLNDAYAPVYSWKWLRHAFSYASVWVAWRAFVSLGIKSFLTRKNTTPS